jgi:FixJ family two-component response regulator
MPTPSPLVLIADRDRAIRESLAFTLGLEGLSVKTFQSADSLRNDQDLPHAACLIIADQPPQIDCFRLLGEIRQAHGQLPALLLTSNLTNALRGKAAASGFAGVLEKPLLDESLTRDVLALLGRKARLV